MTLAGDTPALLETLGRHEVAFVVVGVTAAVLQGAPVVTFDLDIVYQRTPENIARLLAALDEIEAVFRNTPGRRIAPNGSHLESLGHKLLETKLGPIDVLGSLEESTTYEDLLPLRDPSGRCPRRPRARPRAADRGEAEGRAREGRRSARAPSDARAREGSAVTIAARP